jgi:uncharacterized protein YkwD
VYARGFRWLALASALVASLAVAAPAGAGGRDMAAVNSLEAGVLTEINAVRAKRGLKPLRINVKLRAAADAHSAAMGQYGFFAHESRDGSAFDKRVARFYPQGRFGFWSVGENLLWSSGELTPAAALEMWMNSPKHRDNLLTARWREVGLSAVRVPAAPGVFGGYDVTILTADFGVRRSA